MKIAVVHDYFTQLGGAERVAEALFQMFPGATVFTTVVDKKKLPVGLQEAEIRTSWMQKLPAVDRLYRHYVPFYPFAVASLDLTGYDLVISSSSGFAKGVRVDPKAVHVCYCHNPMRWAWRFEDYAAREKFSVTQKCVLPLLVNTLKQWDLDASRQPDQFVVNSKVVAERVRKAYNRNSVVIPPPIDVNRFSIGVQQDDFYLVLSRLVGYKRIDLAIEACKQLKRKLVIIGAGTDRSRLEKMAGPGIEFLGRAPDDVVESYVSRCRALLFPGDEDFGMVPLEVNSAGRPVIAFHAGGATETIIDGLNGVFFYEPTAQSLALAIEDFEKRSWSPQAIRRHAEGFGIQVFEQRMMNLLSSFVRLPGKVSPIVPEKAAVAVA
ncbi:MAG TPA: glycosyltransferase [Bryobacteraceae bacterium]|jgi:glycosyltransferase involved in cell wall biosynthesis|nr:glycosyltransferase [Bryobacteraceae bacterium]